MKRINVDEFDFENRKGQILNCVELATNDNEERSVEVYECEDEKEAIEVCEELNKANKDKHFKYFTIKYLVTENGLEAY